MSQNTEVFSYFDGLNFDFETRQGDLVLVATDFTRFIFAIKGKLEKGPNAGFTVANMVRVTRGLEEEDRYEEVVLKGALDSNDCFIKGMLIRGCRFWVERRGGLRNGERIRIETVRYFEKVHFPVSRS